MPNAIEKTQHRYGVSPFRNATICVITSTKKKIQNSTSGGIRKYALYCVKSASESPCFIRNTAAHTMEAARSEHQVAENAGAAAVRVFRLTSAAIRR